jgi:hypothetical protein
MIVSIMTHTMKEIRATQQQEVTVVKRQVSVQHHKRTPNVEYGWHFPRFQEQVSGCSLEESFGDERISCSGATKPFQL